MGLNSEWEELSAGGQLFKAKGAVTSLSPTFGVYCIDVSGKHKPWNYCGSTCLWQLNDYSFGTFCKDCKVLLRGLNYHRKATSSMMYL